MPISTDGLDGYQIEEAIGRGGFATVYRAADVAHGRSVAIKVLTGMLSPDEQRRFDRERLAIGQLADHPNVVPVYESGITSEGEAYLVLEHAGGGSLGAHLEQQGVLGWEDAVDLIVAVSSAVGAAHRVGIRHRDIKPDNILLSQYGVPKLSDFGIASVASGATTTSSATMTVAHSPPEMLQGHDPTDAVDIYSLASTFHHVVSGRAPFSRPGDANVGALITRVLTQEPPMLPADIAPPAVAAVIVRSMAKRPEDRPQSADEFGRLLREAAGSPDAVLEPPRPAPPAGSQTMAIDRVALGLDSPSNERLTPRPAVRPEPSSEPISTGPAVAPATAVSPPIPASQQVTVRPVTPSPGPAPGLDRTGPTPTGADRSDSGPLGQPHQQAQPHHQAMSGPGGGNAAGGNRRLPLIAAAVAAVVIIGGVVWALVAMGGDGNAEAGSNSSVSDPSGTTSQPASGSAIGPDGSNNPDESDDGSAESGTAEIQVATPLIVAVGEEPQRPVQIGNRVWISNFKSGTISLVGTVSRAVEDTIEAGNGPTTPVEAGGFVWVANQGDNTISKHDAVTGEILATIAVGAEPDTPAIVGNELWVPNLAGATITRVNFDTGTAVGNVALDQRPLSPVVGADAVWVVNQWSGTISQVDPATGSVLQTIPVGRIPQTPVLTAGAVFVANADSGTLSRIDEVTLSVTTIDLGAGSQPAQPIFDGDELWVPLSGSAQLARVDPSTGEVVATVRVDSGPLTPFFDGASLWVANLEGQSIQQVDPDTGEVVQTVSLVFAPGSPVQIGAAVWVSGLFDQRIVIVDYTLLEGASVPTTVPGGAATDPDAPASTEPTDRGATGPFNREKSIQDLITATGAERSQAECIVDALVEQLGEEALADGAQLRPDEEIVVQSVTFSCLLDLG